MSDLLHLTKKRHGRYNLEEEEEGLTHFGQSLGDMEKFDDIQLSDGDDDDEGWLAYYHPLSFA